MCGGVLGPLMAYGAQVTVLGHNLAKKRSLLLAPSARQALSIPHADLDREPPPFTPSVFLFTATGSSRRSQRAVNRNADGVNGGNIHI